jgi:hypothetical protein
LTIGNNFGVTSDGTLYANEGNFSGTITGSTIKGGSITVPETGETKFNVDSQGNLTATGANITGNITTSNLNATGGNISGLTVGQLKLGTTNVNRYNVGFVTGISNVSLGAT